MTAQADWDLTKSATRFSHTRPFLLATCYNPSLFTAPGYMDSGQDWRLGQAGDNFRDIRIPELSHPLVFWRDDRSNFSLREKLPLNREKCCQVTDLILLSQTYPAILAEARSLFFSNSNRQQVITCCGSKSFRSNVLKTKFRD